MREPAKSSEISIYLKTASVISVMGTIWYYFNRPEAVRTLESMPLEVLKLIIGSIS